MKRKTAIVNPWYIVLPVTVLFLLSLLSWANCVKSAGAAIFGRLDKGPSAGVELQEEKTTPVVEERAEAVGLMDRAANGLQSLDGLINRIDSVWSNWIFRKKELSSIDSLLTYYSTKEILSGQVLSGKDNWLFYKTTSDGDPISDYEGTNRFSANELDRSLSSARAAQNELERKGIKFALFIVPNKENVYAEFMPDTYTQADESSTDILIAFLAENGINVVSPKSDLLDNHSRYPLFYTYDTHWNQLGAYIGVRSVLSFWGIDMPELSARSISSSELKDQYHYCGEDDLAKMVGLRSIYNDEQEYSVDGTVPLDWDTFQEEQNDKKVSYFRNDDAELKASLLLVGDSFRSSMIPVLRQMFQEVYVVHRDNYRNGTVETIAPDYLIAEYVERYSRDVVKTEQLAK